MWHSYNWEVGGCKRHRKSEKFWGVSWDRVELRSSDYFIEHDLLRTESYASTTISCGERMVNQFKSPSIQSKLSKSSPHGNGHKARPHHIRTYHGSGIPTFLSRRPQSNGSAPNCHAMETDMKLALITSERITDGLLSRVPSLPSQGTPTLRNYLF